MSKTIQENLMPRHLQDLRERIQDLRDRIANSDDLTPKQLQYLKKKLTRLQSYE